MRIVPCLSLYDVQFVGLIFGSKNGEFGLVSFKEIVDLSEELLLGI